MSSAVFTQLTIACLQASYLSPGLPKGSQARSGRFQDLTRLESSQSRPHLPHMLDPLTNSEMLHTYQFAWNLNKAAGVGYDTKHKVDTLMRQRRRVWKHLEQWLRGTPHRHGCLIVGDLNTPVASEPPVSGTGTVDHQKAQQQDQETFQEMLRSHHCSVLNSWSASGWKARTFIPPGPDDRKQGTQIDFFIARGVMDTAMSRKATPFDAPFVPATGALWPHLCWFGCRSRAEWHQDPHEGQHCQARAEVAP